MIDHISEVEYFEFLDRHEERYRRIEAFLCSNPSTKVWRKLCAELETWPHDEDFLEIILPHVAKKTARWSAFLPLNYPNVFHLQYPKSWIQGALQGNDTPLLRIVKHLELREVSQNQVQQLVTSRHLTWLHEVQFTRVSFPERSHLDDLVREACTPMLNALRFKHGRLSVAALDALVEHLGAARLSTLSFQSLEWSSSHMDVMARALEGLTSLKTLHFHTVGLDDAMCEVLLGALPEAPSLEALSVLGNGGISAQMQRRLQATGLRFSLSPRGNQDIIGYPGTPRP